MLQQTQTQRVLRKYPDFMNAFPTPAALDGASVAEALRLWSGLGYNRRALALKHAASEIVSRFGGEVPADETALLTLPGVGRYTARAVLAFAFGLPAAPIETNVRSVFIHEFFPEAQGVRDRDIEPLAEAALDREDPREWNYALMDYGAMLKASSTNPGRRSAHHVRQSPFADSHRRVRGELLKTLGASDAPLPVESLASRIAFSRERVEKALGELVAEGFVAERAGAYRLAD